MITLPWREIHYVHGEKYTKSFKTLKKSETSKTEFGSLLLKKKEITDHKEIFISIKIFYVTLFKRNSSKTNVQK